MVSWNREPPVTGELGRKLVVQCLLYLYSVVVIALAGTVERLMISEALIGDRLVTTR